MNSIDPIFLAYGALGVMAVLPIYFGSHASIKYPSKKRGAKPEPVAEYFSIQDAATFPIIGSITLFSLYLLFTYFDKAYINYVLTAYFSLLGVGAMVESFMAVARKLTGYSLTGEYRLDLFKKKHALFSLQFGNIHMVAGAFSILIAGYYAITKHWIVSNVYGEAFATSAIQLLNLDSFKTGMLLLTGLFFYDIFWVFGTEVMVTVAKSFDAPIKVLWPKDIWQVIEQGIFSKPTDVQFTMLGLGDIVIPGIFVALCLSFDHHQYLKSELGQKKKFSRSFPKPYFTACLVSYIVGLTTTVVVMHTFQAAQPALLYLSPACIFSVLITAAIRGELADVFAFAPATEESKSPEAELLEAEAVSNKKLAKGVSKKQQ
ncbi:signal peptide peptidase-domain-containing protein [Polychytrium aggregatum]|uniref:signal peptide peptidase-domain-containing protein n=1 Tax=Polychytrium aggregatum TaxID=110093 RepID=UPI0022FF24A3|nr:signal peptide peptidase-domain-containing protein [Polychytrium aggregatum]KAI9203093.1 signal peptide peptidase-domain-containing protein [Polychytrium aggregatum]